MSNTVVNLYRIDSVRKCYEYVWKEYIEHNLVNSLHCSITICIEAQCSF